MPLGEEMAGTRSPETESSLRKVTFLSHSSADAELARTLCSHLEARGIGCWIAPRDVTPSRPCAEEIVRGIESANSLSIAGQRSGSPTSRIHAFLSAIDHIHTAAAFIAVHFPGPGDRAEQTPKGRAERKAFQETVSYSHTFSLSAQLFPTDLDRI